MREIPRLLHKINEEYQHSPRILKEIGEPATENQIEGFKKQLQVVGKLPDLFYDFYRLHNGMGGLFNTLVGGQMMSLKEIIYWIDNWKANKLHYEKGLNNGEKPCDFKHFLPFMLFQEGFVPISWEREYLGRECVIDTRGKIGGENAVKGQIVKYDWKFFAHYEIVAPSYSTWLEIYFDLLKEGFLFHFQMNEAKSPVFHDKEEQVIQKVCGTTYPKYIREDIEQLKQENNWT